MKGLLAFLSALTVAGSLPAPGAPVKLKLSITGAEGTPAKALQPGEGGTIALEADAECRCTLSAVAGERFIRLHPLDAGAEGFPVAQGETWSAQFTAAEPGRYQVVATAKNGEDVSAVLTSLVIGDPSPPTASAMDRTQLWRTAIAKLGADTRLSEHERHDALTVLWQVCGGGGAPADGDGTATPRRDLELPEGFAPPDDYGAWERDRLGWTAVSGPLSRAQRDAKRRAWVAVLKQYLHEGDMPPAEYRRRLAGCGIAPTLRGAEVAGMSVSFVYPRLQRRVRLSGGSVRLSVRADAHNPRLRLLTSETDSRSGGGSDDGTSASLFHLLADMPSEAPTLRPPLIIHPKRAATEVARRHELVQEVRLGQRETIVGLVVIDRDAAGVGLISTPRWLTIESTANVTLDEPSEQPLVGQDVVLRGRAWSDDEELPSVTVESEGEVLPATVSRDGEGEAVWEREIRLPREGVNKVTVRGPAEVAHEYLLTYAPPSGAAETETEGAAEPEVAGATEEPLPPVRLTSATEPAPPDRPRPEGARPRAAASVTTARPFRTHVVLPGDNLSRIGQRYGVSPNELVRLNSLANPNMLRVGQQLTVPGSPTDDISGLPVRPPETVASTTSSRPLMALLPLPVQPTALKARSQRPPPSPRVSQPPLCTASAPQGGPLRLARVLPPQAAPARSPSPFSQVDTRDQVAGPSVARPGTRFVPRTRVTPLQVESTEAPIVADVAYPPVPLPPRLASLWLTPPEAALSGPSPATIRRTYTVAPGDTLLRIAARVGVPAADLARANTLNDSNMVRIGDELVIPDRPVPGTADISPALVAPELIAFRIPPGGPSPVPASVQAQGVSSSLRQCERFTLRLVRRTEQGMQPLERGTNVQIVPKGPLPAEITLKRLASLGVKQWSNALLHQLPEDGHMGAADEAGTITFHRVWEGTYLVKVLGTDRDTPARPAGLIEVRSSVASHVPETTLLLR